MQVSTFNGARTWAVAKPRAAFMMNLETIQPRIAEAIKTAKEASSEFGKASQQAKVAWDVVEELEAEKSHLKAQQGTGPKDPLEDFCEESPDAEECRVYEA